MSEQATLKTILQNGIKSELDLERALIVDRKLRLMVDEQPELIERRKELRSLIKHYEKANWADSSSITDEQVKESDNAEHIAEQERIFLQRRKEAIKQKLTEYDLTQQDLGKVLGHGKSYMSELINGISPFSNRDLIILHRLLSIKLDDLIPTVISHKDRIKLNESLRQLNKPNLKLRKEDLIIV